jgi:23S rRNA (adenine2503-C2)-methyltransferase
MPRVWRPVATTTARLRRPAACSLNPCTRVTGPTAWCGTRKASGIAAAALPACDTPLQQAAPTLPHSSAALPQPRLPLLDLSYERLSELLVSMGKPKYKATQVWRAVFAGGATALGDVTTLSKVDRQELAAAFSMPAAHVQAARVSTDGTRKWLLHLPGPSAARAALGVAPSASTPASVEAVLIPDRRRRTLCVSSQAGCSLNCSFCHTGTQKLQRNLTQGDILEQVLVAQRDLAAVAAGGAHSTGAATAEFGSSGGDGGGSATSSTRKPAAPARMTNIVFMGQGEPLLNWRAVRGAIQTLTHPMGLAMAPRRITVSTSGIAPVIPRLAEETPGVRLALSLHAPTDALRSRIMSINQQYDLATVMAACGRYLEISTARVAERARARELQKGSGAGAGGPGRRGGDGGGGSGVAAMAEDDESDSDDEDDEAATRSGRYGSASCRGRAAQLTPRHNSARRVRVTFEYVMLAGVNDSPAQAAQLVALMAGHMPRHQAHVNLIPFNPWPGAPYGCSPRPAIERFQAALLNAGIRANVRESRGDDVMGACGQLKSAVESKAAVRPRTDGKASGASAAPAGARLRAA